MKYFENAFKFLGRFYILAVPLFVLYALTALVKGSASAGTTKSILDIFTSFGDISSFQDPTVIFEFLPVIIGASVGAFILSLILKFVVQPATYGMVKKTLNENRGDLNDFVPSLKDNFVKYIVYWAGTVVVGAIFVVALFIVLAVLGLLTLVLKWVGFLLIALALLAFAVAGVVVYTLLSLWFTAMLVDNLDIMSGLKKSVEIARGSFWTILGITILVGVLGGIASAILGLIIGWIPVIGPIITSAVPTAAGMIMIVFYLLLYNDRTGRSTAAA